MLRRNRRNVAFVVLAAIGVPLATAAWFYFQSIGWRPSLRVGGALAALVILAAATNAARFWRRRKMAKPKKRPSHLRVVRSHDDTLH